MIDENEVSKEIEKALSLEPKSGNGTRITPPSKITLSVQIDQVIDGLNSRIKALEAFKATL